MNRRVFDGVSPDGSAMAQGPNRPDDAGGLAGSAGRALRGGVFDSPGGLGAGIGAVARAGVAAVRAGTRPRRAARPWRRGPVLLALAMAALLCAAPGARAELLISNLLQGTATTAGQSLRPTVDIAQGFTTGGNTTGYTLESIEIFFQGNISSTDIGDLTATVREADGDGDPGTTVATLSNPASITAETDAGDLDAADAAVFTAPDGTTLAAGTVYFVVLDFDEARTMWGTFDDGENPGGAAGWSIADDGTLSSGSGWENENVAYYIRVHGEAAGDANNVPVFADATLTRTVPENSPADTNVGAAIPAATDADTGDTLVYSMEGADMASFNFNVTTRQITTKSGVTYNFEATKNSYSVTISVSDGTDSDTVAVTISLTNVNELPTAPTGLTVAPTLGAGGSLDASWTAPTNTGKPTITGYKLQYSTSSSGPWSNGPQNVTGTSSTFTTGLSENTLYYVRVLAFNSDGDGAWSSTDSATTTIATTITNCPAPTLTGRSQIWSATVSLETGDVNNLVPYIGFNTVTPHDVFGALSDTSFEVGTNSYTVRTLATLPTASDALFLSLNSHVTDTEKAELTLHVCDVAVALSSATVVDSGGFKAYQWVYGVDWSDYATREAYLSVPRTNTAPTAANGTVATATNTAYTFDAGDFNFADTDSGDTLEKVKIVTLPDAGTLALSGTTVTVNQEVTKADIDADNLTFTPVTDATGSPYTTFTFKVNDGDDESASAYTMTVNVTVNMNVMPPPAADVLISNLNIGTATTSGQQIDSTVDIAQGFTTGGNTAGYTLESIEIFFQGNISSTDIGDLTATVREADGDGDPGTTVATLSNPASITGEDDEANLDADDAAVFTAPDGTTLAAGTVYFVVLDFDLQRNLWGTADNGENAGGAAGWSIADDSTVSSGSGWVTASLSYYIRVRGAAKTAAINTAPTAADGTVTTTTNTAYAFDAGDFNFADTDAGDTLEKVKIVTLPDAGTLALSGTAVTVNQEVTKANIDAGNLTFTPVAGATGSPHTTFTFKVNDGDDESASAYTMSVNVTALSVCTAPDYAGDLSQIWTGALTVGNFDVSGSTFYGYNSTTDPVTGALSDTAFMVGTTEHTVESVSVGSGAMFGELLAFKFTTDPATSVVNKLVLYACHEDFAMRGFDPGGTGGYTLADTGLDWSSETSLNLYMAIDDTAPELQTAEVAGSTLVLTYDEALDEDNGVPASAFAVTVAGGTATAPSSVAVDGATVTLMLGSAVTVGQTVTLTYTKETGVPRVRDVFTNEAAVLTDRAVTNNSAGIATGAPTISGVAQVGATLTASTAGIADTDGKTKADNGDTGFAYTYQWVRENADGTSPVDISGATSSTYPVVAADVGKKLKVKVSFTDDADNDEGPLTSTATGVVIAAAATTVTIAADEPVITNALSHMNFTLTRTGDTSAALTVTVTLKQTARFLTDSGLSGTADFDEDATTADFQVHVRHFRHRVTAIGEVTATIAPGTGYGVGTPGAATVAVKAAEPAMTVRIEQDAYEVREDVAGGKATVYLLAQMAPGFPAPNHTWPFALSAVGDVAGSPDDFMAQVQNVDIRPGDWQEVAGRFEARRAVEVTIVDDGLVEPDESLNLLLRRTAGLPIGPVLRLLPNGDACPIPAGQTARECKSTLTILNDDVLPVLDTATVNGVTLVLTYDRALDGDSDPAASAYSVAGTDVTLTAVDADGATVTLTLATAVTSGQSVTLDYTVPTMNPVTDSHGNQAPALDDQPVHNVAGDTTAPELLNAQVDGAVLVLTYNEALDPGSEPAVGDFGVQVTPSGGSASRRNVSTVDVSGSKVTLTLASAVLLSDSVTMAYVVPSSNPLQDVAGNDAPAFSGQTVGNAGNSLPIFPDATLTRELKENTAPDVNVGAPIPAATDPDGHDLTYTLEGADADSFEFDAMTRQISTKTGVTYDYEVTTSYEVTVRAADDFGGEDTVTVTIDVKNLPGFSIAPLQERILLSDGRVRFELTADTQPSVEITVLNYTATQDEAWLAAEALQGTLVHITEEAMNFSGPDFKRDAPARSGNVTFTLQPGDGYELGATTSATVAIVAADPLITVRATQAAYSVSEDHGTLAVTLIAETIVGAPMPNVSTARIAWAAVADEATGGGADFRDAGANSLVFHSDNFSEEGGRWVLEREVEVTVVEDNDWELDEEFHIALSRFVEEPPFAPYMHPLVKLANFDGTLCVDNDADEICGATVTILSSDNAAPAFSSATATREVAENSPADTDVGAPVTATDADTGDGDALTYSLEGDDAASFAIDAASGQITTITGVDYDFETDPSYAVTVKATDRQDASATVAVTINLTDIDPEGPVCRAPDFTDREQVWMAEMTVGSSTVVPGPLTLYGFDGGSNSYGSLSDDDFRIGTATYDVSALNLWVVIDGQLTFNVESLPERGAVLHICNESFTLADAMLERSGGRDEYTWTNTDLDWSAVETRNVYLSLTPLPPPELELGSLTVDGTTVVLTFDADLDESSIPPSDNFEVLVTPEGGTATPRRVRGVRVRGRAVTLELESAVMPGDEVSVEYLGPDGEADAALKGADGGTVPPFGDSGRLRNITVDTVAPVLQSQSVSAATLVLRYDEALDESSEPAEDAYEVQVAPPDGTAERRDVDAVTISGDTVTLTLASPVRPSEIVTLAYAVPASNPVQDLSGNDAAAIDPAVAVANETAGNRAPHILGASASGHITREVPENSGGGVKVGEPIHAEDPDGDRLSWKITRFQRTITSPDSDPNTGSHVISTEWVEWGASAYFTIDSGTGQIRTKSDVDYDYEERRSYFIEVEVTDGLGGVAQTDVLIELTDEGEPEDSPLLAPEGLTLRKLGPTAVRLSWQNPASSAAIDKHQFRLGRHPTSVDGVLGGIGPQSPANRVFKDDGWMDFPAGAAGPLGHVLRGSVGGQPLIHVWELKAQVRSVTAEGEVSQPSNVAFMPDTAPTMVTVGVVSDPGSDGVYESGETIAVALELDEPVRVRGRPRMNLQIHGQTREARYAGLSHPFREAEVGWGANEGTILRFEYDLVSADGQVRADDILIDNRVILNGATVTDATRVGNGLPALLSWASAGVTPVRRSRQVALPELSVADTAATEGPDAHMSFTVTLSAASPSSATVDYATADGSATAGSDYTASSGTLTFPAGETSKTVTVGVLQDNDEEADETLTLRLSKAVGANLVQTEATGTIVDGEPLDGLSVSGAQATEGVDSSLSFNVRLTQPFSNPVTVDYETADGTATAGPDYTASSGTLTFAAGQTSKTVTVEVLQDNDEEEDETLTLRLSNASGAVLKQAEATGTIINGEPLDDPMLSISDARAKEGEDSTMSFKVTLYPAADDRVSVEYVSYGGNATEGEDYNGVGAILHFKPGETSKTIAVDILDDEHNEGEEYFNILLYDAQGAGIEDDTGKGVIVNTGPMPQAWLARFGRAASDHVIDAVADRWQDGAQSAHLTIGGRQVGDVFGAWRAGEWFTGGDPARAGALEPEGRWARMDRLQTTAFAGGSLAGGNLAGGNGTRDNAAGGSLAGSMSSIGGPPSVAGGSGLDRGSNAASSNPAGSNPAGSSPEGSSPEGGNPAGSNPAGGNPAGGNPAGGSSSGGRAARAALMGALGLPDMSGMDDLREVLMGSSFFYSRPLDENGMARTSGWLGDWSAWGRTASTRFSGAEGKLSLDGEVATAMLGVDSRWSDRWLAGVVLSLSQGEGAYKHPTSLGGAVTSTMTGLHPYARYEINERTSLWGVLGYGVGELSLTPEGSGTVLETDLTNAMAAFGGRMALSVRSGEAGRFELAIRSDARLTNTASGAIEGLVGAVGQTGRLRLTLDGSGLMPLATGGVLIPTLEAGLRYDAGDAETGAGLEVGGGLGYAAGNLSVQVNARGLLAHEDAEYEEWGFSGSIAYTPGKDGRGLSMQLGWAWGATQSGVQSLWSRQDASGLASNGPFEAAQRFQAELGYGIAGRREAALWVPFIAAQAAEGGGQELRMGVKLTSGPDVEMGLEFGRRAGGREPAEHAVQLNGSIRW